VNLEKHAKTIELHEYLRSGHGLSGLGTQQAAIQGPEDKAECRIGNDTESYDELVFVNNRVTSCWSREQASDEIAPPLLVHL
jgi:maltoporin